MIYDFIRIFAERKSGFLNKTSEKSGLILRLRNRIIPITGMIIVFIISLSVLYLGEHVGLSDNGDFRRVMLVNNIEYADDTDSHYLFKEHYKMNLDESSFGAAVGSAWHTNNEEEIYSSPHFLIIKLSKEMNIIANAISGRPFSDYNIIYLALLYIFMLSIAAGVIFTFFADAKPRLQGAVFVMFIFIFCDAGYLLYFNSFYGEPLQYTALLMLVSFGMLIYKRPSVPKVIGFYVSLYFFAGAKLANIPYSLMAALLGILIMIMRRDKLFRIGVIACAVTCIAAIIGLYSSIPDWMDRDTTYQSVFFGITKNSEDPKKDLRELGVDEKYAVLAGTHAYMDEDEYPIDLTTDEFKHDFYDKVSKADVTAFYIKHPIRLAKELCVAIENSAYIRPPVLGNSETVPMQLTNKFSGWSKLRVALRFLYTPWVIFMCFISITVYMVFMNVFYIHNHKIESPERKYMIFSLDVLIIGLWINLLLPIICNGEGDIVKHMFLFTNCIDILFFVCVLMIVGMNRRQIIKWAAVICAFNCLFYIHKPYKTVNFGRINGQSIQWNILRRYNDGSVLLVTKKCIGRMPFDNNSNDWETSELREWLNDGFIDEFSDDENARIITTENKVPLTYEDREKAEDGDHAHYWNFTRSLLNDMGESAYHYTVEDKVYIPTLDMMKDIDAPDSYWILCPYTSNDYMQRFLNRDGFGLHTDVRNEQGVRAVIRVKLN